MRQRSTARNYAPNKKYALNSECALNRKGLRIEGGTIDLVRFKMLDDRDCAYRVREPLQALAFFDENLLDSLGPWV